MSSYYRVVMTHTFKFATDLVTVVHQQPIPRIHLCRLLQKHRFLLFQFQRPLVHQLLQLAIAYRRRTSHTPNHHIWCCWFNNSHAMQLRATKCNYKLKKLTHTIYFTQHVYRIVAGRKCCKEMQIALRGMSREENDKLKKYWIEIDNSICLLDIQS